MPILLLLVLTLTCLQHDWPAPPEWLRAPGVLLLTWGTVAIFAGAAWLAAWIERRRLMRDPFGRAQVVGRYTGFRRWHLYLLFAAHAVLVCLGGWGWLVAAVMVNGDFVVPGTDLLLVSPLLAGLMLSWAGYHPLEQDLNSSGHAESTNSFPGRWAFVVLQARHHFLLIAPPLALMFVQQLLLAVPGVSRMPLAMPLIGLCLLGTMYTAVPSMLRLWLGLKPLPGGPVRDRLMATAQRLSFRCNDILVWNTRHTVANAMVTGPLPILRYVILTDRLLDELTAEEIEAVFGHEVGHIKHHHLLFYFAFLLASMIVVMGLWKVLNSDSHLENWFQNWLPASESWLAAYQVLSALPLLGILGGYIFLVFGFLSRRCERQADIYGCRTVSVPVFIDALEKVASLNGISRDKPGWLMSWQHSTIALRVEFLQQMATDPSLEPRFQRRLGLVKWGTVLCLGAIIAGFEPATLWAVLGMLGN